MQRTEKNIETVSTELHGSLNRPRQSSIDEELFDVVAGLDRRGAKEQRSQFEMGLDAPPPYQHDANASECQSSSATTSGVVSTLGQQ